MCSARIMRQNCAHAPAGPMGTKTPHNASTAHFDPKLFPIRKYASKKQRNFFFKFDNLPQNKTPLLFFLACEKEGRPQDHHKIVFPLVCSSVTYLFCFFGGLTLHNCKGVARFAAKQREALFVQNAHTQLLKPMRAASRLYCQRL